MCKEQVTYLNRKEEILLSLHWLEESNLNWVTVFEMATSFPQHQDLFLLLGQDLSTAYNRWSEFLITLLNLELVITTKVFGAPRNMAWLLVGVSTLKENSAQPDVQRRCLPWVTCSGWQAVSGVAVQHQNA